MARTQNSRLVSREYSMDIITASTTKLYNSGQFWAFNTAKYRALLSGDPVIIKEFYKIEAGKFYKDIFTFAELARSFYKADENSENAEQFFGIIPLIVDSIVSMVCGSGFEFVKSMDGEDYTRLQDILDDNNFEDVLLTKILGEILGLGDTVAHIRFDPLVSKFPVIEHIPAEDVEIERVAGRVKSVTIKQRVTLDNTDTNYVLKTKYSHYMAEETAEDGTVRHKPDGVLQENFVTIQDGGNELEDNTIQAKIFKEYGVEKREQRLPLTELPAVYFENPMPPFNKPNMKNFRPYGLVFGLESVSSALDEILSNCADHIRKSFPFVVIDENVIPPSLDGYKDRGNFSTRRHSFVLPKNLAGTADKLIQFIDANLQASGYIEAAKFQINIALNKAKINAATLGLQLSGHVESEATQNARERNSIRTRNLISRVYAKQLCRLFRCLLQYDDFINGSTVVEDEDTSLVVVEEYKDIVIKFNKYLVNTPEEVSTILARKVASNLSSIPVAVHEMNPEWTELEVMAESDRILIESGRQPIYTELYTMLAERMAQEKDPPPTEGDGDDPQDGQDPTPPNDSPPQDNHNNAI